MYIICKNKYMYLDSSFSITDTVIIHTMIIDLKDLRQFELNLTKTFSFSSKDTHISSFGLIVGNFLSGELPVIHVYSTYTPFPLSKRAEVHHDKNL